MFAKDGVQLRIQRQITAALAANTGLETVLQRILRAAARLCGAHMAAITLLASGGQELEVIGTFGTKTSMVGERLAVDTSLCGLVLTTGCQVQSIDALHDRRLAVRAFARRTGARGVLAVPLHNGAAGALGTLSVARRTPWRCTEQAALASLAASATIAIQLAALRMPLTRVALRAEEDQSSGSSPVLAVAATRRSMPDPALRSKAHSHLSSREHEILQLVISGKTYKEVAAFLGISARTVEHYVEHVKQRFHESRLLPLVDYLVGHGLIQRNG